MALLGLLFAACGLWAWWRRPDRFTSVFLLYCLGAGVHWGGSIGAGEAFCDGLWSTPDLTTVVRILARNQDALHGLDSGAGALTAPFRRLLHQRRSNTRSGSLRNIAAHYDTGNEFFSKFLDSTLTYSCGIFPDATSSLETAQLWKLDTICRKLELRREDHLL